jgi:hypothetical protein
MKPIRLLLAVLIVIASVSVARSQWQVNGIPICDTSANSGFYMLPQIAADGNGGAFVCWRDARRGEFDIYMQRIHSDGTMQFPPNGTSFCNAPNSQQFPRMISDGRAGAYIAWEDDRTTTQTYVYVQRINSLGQALWTANGVRAADIGGLFISLALEPITGGVLLGWSTVADAFVQRLDSLGNRMWGDSGMQVTNRPENVRAGDVAVTTDGNGGMIVVWAEGSSSNYEVYAQRVDSVGTPQWIANGIFLGPGGGVTISGGENGEVIITWVDNLNTYAQKVNGSGQRLWGANGIFVGSGGGRHVLDGLGGAFVWHGNKVQHLNASGIPLWDSSGVSYTSAQFPTSTVGLLDRNIGIWMFWSAPGGSALDIFGQYIQQNGVVRWASSGALISGGGQLQDFPRGTSSNDGTAVVVWDDFRNGHSNVYAAKVDTNGVTTEVEENQGFLLPAIPKLEQNYPNPFNPTTQIQFSLPTKSYAKVEVFDILGRPIATLVDGVTSSGRHEVLFSGNSLPSGVYVVRLQAGEFQQMHSIILAK